MVLNGHWPADYHAPEQRPEDQGWGWLIALVVAGVAVAAAVLIDGPAAVAVIVAAVLLVLSRVLLRRRSKT